MTDEHLSVPESWSNFTPAITGRARSSSTRSDRSGNSEPSIDRVVADNPGYGSRRPSIRIRRFPSNHTTTQLNDDEIYNEGSNNGHVTFQGSEHRVARHRAPLRLVVPGGGPGVESSRQSPMRPSVMPDVAEEVLSPANGTPVEYRDIRPVSRDFGDLGAPEVPVPVNEPDPPRSGWRTLRRARTNIGIDTHGRQERDYESELVDLLDLLDPEVATLTTLNNVQNSLFIPNLGRFLNRRPTYDLTRPDWDDGITSSSDDGEESTKVESTATARPQPSRAPTGATLNTLTSRVNDKYFAVLPHGVGLPGWTEEDKLELNDHVRHMLHSKRSKFKRGLKGFGQYFRTPLGAFGFIYATLITLFGLTWVLFLIGWISLGSRKDYIVNIVDNILVALFAIMGDGLAPFRAVDTYHMCFIAHYHHLTWRLRKQQALPKLHNNNDLPGVQPEDLEAQTKNDIKDAAEFSVLSPEQVKRLAHHQKKFSSSHSFYKPHETATHHAFPLRLLIAIVVLLDCHSLLQIALGTCTWAISYHVRPFALTTVILCCSITVNITAGILISIGDHKTRKKDVRERMYRQELTAEAMKKMNKKAKKQLKKYGELDEEDLEVKNLGGVFQPLAPLKELDSGQFGVDEEKRAEAEKQRRESLRVNQGHSTSVETAFGNHGPTPPPKDGMSYI